MIVLVGSDEIVDEDAPREDIFSVPSPNICSNCSYESAVVVPPSAATNAACAVINDALAADAAADVCAVCANSCL